MGNKGFFISMEGIDGSGKFTQAKLLLEGLVRAGHNAILTREPGGTRLGEAIRELLISGMMIGDIAQALLYNAARAESVERVIKPCLSSGQIVISDRFHDSTIAYQGCGEGVNIHRLRLLEPLVLGGLYPDLTFYLQVTIEEAARRDPAIDLELDYDFYRFVQKGYDEIGKGATDRWVAIDGMRPIDEIHRDILGKVIERWTAIKT